MKALIFITILCISFYSCTVNHTSTSSARNNNAVETSEARASKRNYMDLTHMIREVPGINVTGDGLDATIRIRAQVNSIHLTSSPLFVLDGMPMGHEYSNIYQAISVNEVASVKVLKGPDAAFYGVRGANGVIIIHSKR